MPAEEGLLLLLLHLLDVVAQQLPHLPRDEVLLLLGRLQLREHRHPRHPRHCAVRLNHIPLRDLLRQRGLQRISDSPVDGLRGDLMRACAWFCLLLVFEVVLVEVFGHAAVEVGDLPAVGLVAEDVVLLGVVVLEVVVADLAVQCGQAHRLFHLLYSIFHTPNNHPLISIIIII